MLRRNAMGTHSYSYWGKWGGESTVSSMLSTSTSSDDDRRIVEPSPRGEETAVQASEPWQGALDLVGEEEERDRPISIPSTRSICNPHDHSHHSVLAATGPEPRGTLVRAPSSKRALWEQSVRNESCSQCTQSAPSRAD